MFGNKELKALIVPLFMEQLLTILVGLVDTFVISFVSEAAVSGVPLVNSFNTIFIFLFTALASGGALQEHWKDPCNHVYCSCFQSDQCGREYHRRIYTSCRRGRSGMVDCDNHWREACIFCPVCSCIPYGCDRDCTGDVSGLVHTGSHILCPIQKR